MSLKLSDLISPMLAAAKGSLKKDWPKVKHYAEPEFKKLAQSLIDITKLLTTGELNGRQAKALFQIHRNTTQMVLLCIEGMGIIAVENAINSAIKAVRDIINTAAGIRIL